MMEQNTGKNAAIRVENLVKTFKDVRAVDGISFTANEGELFAFLGENGAGKSTSIAVICGLLKKDGGKVYVAGRDIDEDDSVKSEIGVVFQASVLDKALSARDNLTFRAALYGIAGKDCEKRIEELNALLDFGEFIDRPLAKLSGGQKRKIDIARALLNKPKILILDEPTTGLDPQTRKTVWAVAEKLQREEKMTVFLTTHYMEETAKADYVVILDHGKIAAEGTPRQLKNEYTGRFHRCVRGEKRRIRRSVRERFDGENPRNRGRSENRSERYGGGCGDDCREAGALSGFRSAERKYGRRVSCGNGKNAERG